MKMKVISLLVFLLVLGSSLAKFPTETSSTPFNETELETSPTPFNMLSENAKQKLILLLLKNPKDPCLNDLWKIYSGIYNSELWALKFLDASSKIQSGILDGNIFNLGSYDECLAIRNPDDTIKGKYCLTTTTISLAIAGYLKDKIKSIGKLKGIPFVWALCIPNRCSQQNITTLVNIAFNSSIDFKFGLFDFDRPSCQDTDSQPEWRIGDWAMLIFIILLVLWTFFCTIVDIYSFKPGKPGQIFKIFSLYSNGSKWIATNTPGQNTITCLNGLRIISLYWIILAHRSLILKEIPVFINNLEIVEDVKSTAGQYLIGGHFSVDTFFVISGFLVSTGVLRQLDKRNGKLPWHLFYLHRFVRLTTALIFIILFSLTLLKYMGDGPIWNQILETSIINNCVENWWITLIYAQNYLSPTKRCLDPSWYLSVDMQLYAISPILLYYIWRYKHLAYTTLSAILFILHLIAFKAIWDNRIRASIFAEVNNTESEVSAWKTSYYQQTHTRASPWVLGVFLGYYLYRTGVNKKFNWLHMTIGWIIALILVNGSIIGAYPLVQTGNVYNRLVESSYILFSRTAWSISICWIIYACHLGYGVHIVYQLASRATVQTSEHYSMGYVGTVIISDIVVSTVIATAIYLFVECPVFEMESWLLRRSVAEVKVVQPTPELVRPPQYISKPYA